MKRIKLLLVLFVVLFLSGCTVNYNLTINDDLSVNEKVEAQEITNRMKSNTGLDRKKSIYYLYDMFDRKDIKTKLTYKSDTGYTTGVVTGSHNSLEDYSESFKSDIVPEVKYTVKDNIVTLEFDQEEVLSSNTSTSPVYEEVVVNIIVPFKVTESNASESYRNRYTWKIRKDEKVKKIKISFDKSDLKYKKLFSIGDKTFSVRYQYIAIGIILFVILSIVLVVYINNKKNNRM